MKDLPYTFLLDLVAETAAPVFERTLTEDSCLNATRILLDVLRELGFKARPLSVRAFAFNEVYIDRLKRGLPPLADPASWGLGIETRPNVGGKGWPGHVVALVENRWLVDGSAGQFARPAKDILVPRVLVGEFSKKGRASYTLEGGGEILYEARPHDVSFTKMPGFQPHEGNVGIAKEILRRVQAREGGST